jgi:hypothetical protein
MSGGTEHPAVPLASADEQRVLAAYRAASAALDEAPSADTRAAIVAAAARAAGSRPRPIGQPRRWRLPLAAAASVLVGTIALLIATQVEQPPAGGEADAVADAVPRTPAPAAPEVAAASGQNQAAAPQTPRVEPPAPTAPSAGAPAAAKAAPSGAALSGRRALPQPGSPPTPPAPRTVDAFPAAAPTAGGAPATAAPGQALGSTAESLAGAGQPRPAPPPPPADARGAAPAPAVAAPAPARLSSELRRDSAAETEAPWRSRTETWIERIVKLRAEDRHAEADAELAALRARHPDLRLPASVLPPEPR